MTQLAEELEKIKAVFAAKNDPSIVAAYQKGIDELRAAGLERNALKAGEAAPDFTLPELQALGAQLIALSPESPDNSLSTQEKNALAFSVLSDAGGRIAGAYRLAFELSPELQAIYRSRGRDLSEWNGGDWTLPAPGTFVIGRDGRVALAHVDADYRSRLEPAEALATVRKLAGG